MLQAAEQDLYGQLSGLLVEGCVAAGKSPDKPVSRALPDLQFGLRGQRVLGTEIIWFLISQALAALHSVLQAAEQDLHGQLSGPLVEGCIAAGKAPDKPVSVWRCTKFGQIRSSRRCWVRLAHGELFSVTYQPSTGSAGQRAAGRRAGPVRPAERSARGGLPSSWQGA